MTAKKICLVVLLGGLAAAGGGCEVALVGAGAAAGVAGAGYIRGDLEATIDKRLDVVYNASLKAVEDLKLPVIEKKKNVLEAKIVSRTVSDKNIQIKLKRTETDMTSLSIRIGTFGDETQSRAIYKKIQENL